MRYGGLYPKTLFHEDFKFNYIVIFLLQDFLLHHYYCDRKKNINRKSKRFKGILTKLYYFTKILFLSPYLFIEGIHSTEMRYSQPDIKH